MLHLSPRAKDCCRLSLCPGQALDQAATGAQTCTLCVGCAPVSHQALSRRHGVRCVVRVVLGCSPHLWCVQGCTGCVTPPAPPGSKTSVGKEEYLRQGWLRNRRADLHHLRRLRAGIPPRRLWPSA
jgi:hypothetical protein